MRRFRKAFWLTVFGVLLAAAVLAFAGRFAATREAAMPDQLNLGTLYQGARVEIDVRLLTSARLSPLEQLFERITGKLPQAWARALQDLHPKRFRPPPAAIDVSALKPQVSVPPFLKIERITPAQRTNWFQGNPFVQVDLLVDTSRTGAVSGEITAVLNKRRATLPSGAK